MPYASIDDLPAPVRHHFPADAQETYRAAFNHAWRSYSRNANREQIAHRVAWAAVKRRFHKGADGQWYPDHAASPW